MYLQLALGALAVCGVVVLEQLYDPRDLEMLRATVDEARRGADPADRGSRGDLRSELKTPHETLTRLEIVEPPGRMIGRVLNHSRIEIDSLSVVN